MIGGMRRKSEPEYEEEESEEQQHHHQQQEQLLEMLQPKLLKFNKAFSNGEFSDCGCRRGGPKSVRGVVATEIKETSAIAAAATIHQ